MKNALLPTIAAVAMLGLVACDTNSSDVHSAEVQTNPDDENQELFELIENRDGDESAVMVDIPEEEETFGEKAEDWWNRTVDDIEEGYDDFKDTAAEFAEDVREKSADIMDDIEDAYQEFKEDLQEWYADEEDEKEPVTPPSDQQ